jgi:hypothetical protein
MLTNAGFWTDSVDWNTALGKASYTTGTHDSTSGAWLASSNGGSTGPIQVSLQTTDGTGAPNGFMARADNLYRLYQGAPVNDYVSAPLVDPDLNYYTGTFDSQPNPGAGNPGDHLIVMSGSPNQRTLIIRLLTAQIGAAFRISSNALSTFTASVKAYSVLNPTGSDVPIATATLNNVTGGGDCSSGLGQDPPVPCNTAPFFGVHDLATPIMSLVVSTNDNQGFAIDTLFLQDWSNDPPPPTPEPAVAGLIGGGILLLVSCSKRFVR